MLLACCAAPVILSLDYAAFSVLAPQIRADLGLGDGELAWLFSAYSAGYGAFLLVAGRCADRYGARTVLTGGLALFALAVIAVAAAGGPAPAIAARAVQGAAAAMMFAASLSALTAAGAGGAFAAAIGIGFAAGALAAAALASAGGWRLGVLVAAPCCLVAAAAARRLPGGSAATPAVGVPTALAVGTLVAAGAAGASLAGLPATALAAAVLVAFVGRIGTRTVAVACAAGLVLTATCVAGTLALAVVLARDHSVLEAGAVLACFGLAAVPGARVAGRIGRTWPAGALLGLGLAVQGAALAAAAAAAGTAVLAGCISALGLGHVLGNAATADVAARAGAAHGTIAGALGSAQRLGGALGPLLLAPTHHGLAVGGAVTCAAAALAWLVLLHVPSPPRGRHLLVR